MDMNKIYPCGTKGCKNMRSLEEGGITSELCDECFERNNINDRIREIDKASTDARNKATIDIINKELVSINITTELFTTILKAILSSINNKL